MIKKNNYKKSKTLYTIKDVHAKTKAGTIYENDYVTIINNDGIFNEDIPLFSESNFKFKIDTSDNGKKRHMRSDWVSNESGETWTWGNVSGHTMSEESKIVLKPNYTSMKDFAYYGSAIELLRATISDIILRFPGGLYYYSENYAPEVTLGDKKYLLISNECQIDCWSDGITSIKENENPLRYLSYSYNDYEIEKPTIVITGNCVNSIIGKVKIDGNEFLIYKDGEKQNHLVLEKDDYERERRLKLEREDNLMIIEPKEEIIENFWNSLDDFERVLLNRDTIPKYTAIFDTPFSDETGFYYNKKTYTWPTIANSITPDLTTPKFKGYLESLMSLAEFHDEYDSDNIWRMMTHESIKNLDWTFVSNDRDMTDIDNGKMKALIHIQGRLYDDIKRNIDNIKYNNNISYNQINNSPDYFLSDIIENDGWEAKNVSELSNNKVNAEFLRRLSLNSNYIQSMKGTRKGIEAILGMFGYKINENYEINECIAKTKRVFSEFPTYEEVVCLRTEFDYVNADNNTNFMQGYPVAIVEYKDEDKTELKLIPWYDSNEKYEGDFYFQSKGGWYRETEPYVLYVNTLYDLIRIPNDRLFDEIYCYVVDISDKDNKYKFENHYFKLENKYHSTIIGIDNETGCTGWTEANNEEIEYLESIIQNYKGNNPHTGRGKYDSGEEYLQKYVELFNNVSDYKIRHLPQETQEKIRAVGFGDIDKIKILATYYKGSCTHAELTAKTENTVGDVWTVSDGTDYVWTGDGWDVLADNDNFNPKIYNYIGTDKVEKESYRYINIKNLYINFKEEKEDFKEDFKNYIKTTVMPYLEMMIPSSTILEILFNDEPLFDKIITKSNS